MIAIFPEIAAKAASNDFENLAVLVRKYFGGSDTYAPCPDMAALVDNVGIKIQRVPFECEGALLARDERGTFEIIAIVREGTEAEAERFLLAHLLGHFLFDVQPLIARGDWTVSGLREVVCPERRYSNGFSTADVSAAELKKEERADDFAAAILMPRGMIVRAMEKIGNAERVAGFFGVSRACLTRRLQQIGVTESYARDFLSAERQLGRDDQSAGSTPRQSASALLSRDIDPLDGLARAVGPIAAPAVIPPRITMRPATSATGRPQQSSAAGAVARPQQSPAASSSPQRSIPIFEEKPGAQSGNGGTLKKGMDRIRQIARLLDKSDEKNPEKSGR